MAKETFPFVAFNGGLVSPRVRTRIDVDWRHRALADLTNMVPLVEGPAKRRSGFRHVASAKTAGTAVRLIPFRASVEQAYMIEASDQALRFYASGVRVESGGSPVEVSAPWAAAELAGLDWTQSNDVLYLTHPDHPPYQLVRNAHTSWTLSEITFVDGPYFDENATTDTITPSATTGTGITLTASASSFVATDVGRLVQINHSGTIGYAVVTAFTSATEVTADVVNDFGATTASAAWRLGFWSETTGYPRCVVIHKGRLWFGGAAGDPSRLDGSKVQDFTNFTPGVEDDDAVSFIVEGGGQSNVVRWLRSNKNLLAGTSGEEFSITSSDGVQITPSDFSVVSETKYGSAAIRPVVAGKSVIFCQFHARRLLDFNFRFEDDGFDGADLTRRAGSYFEAGIVELAWQQEPEGLLWVLLSGGELMALTLARRENVLGWSRHVAAPTGAGASTVESIACIPGEGGDSGEDQLWAVVVRTVDGSVTRSVERLERFFEERTAQADQFFVDGGITYDGSATDTITGLDHLEDETVQVLADGKVHPPQVVSGGEITLLYEASVVHAGLPFEWSVAPLAFEAGARTGPAAGAVRKLTRLAMDVNRTGQLTVTEGDVEESPVFTKAGDPMDTAPDLYTGVLSLNSNGGWGREQALEISGNAPTHAEIMAIYPRQTVSEQ